MTMNDHVTNKVLKDNKQQLILTSELSFSKDI
jgi:hypothetical protein